MIFFNEPGSSSPGSKVSLLLMLSELLLLLLLLLVVWLSVTDGLYRTS